MNNSRKRLKCLSVAAPRGAWGNLPPVKKKWQKSAIFSTFFSPSGTHFVPLMPHKKKKKKKKKKSGAAHYSQLKYKLHILVKFDFFLKKIILLDDGLYVSSSSISSLESPKSATLAMIWLPSSPIRMLRAAKSR